MLKDGKTWVLIALLVFCGALILGRGGVLSSYAIEEPTPATPVMPEEPQGPKEIWPSEGPREGMARILGIVEDGRFYPIADANQPMAMMDLRLTRIAMYESVPPESDELNLDEFEGMAIMVEGLDGGGWMYETIIVDKAGPIVTALVEQFLRESHPPEYNLED
jgi:hypothetical protein